MKKHYLTILTLATLGLLASCGSSNEKTAAEQVAESKAAEEAITCTYTIPTPDSTVIAWTAYKTTDKVAVGGKFTEFTIDSLKEGSSIEEAFEDVTITIPVASINTNNSERDERIKKFFFGMMDSTMTLTGSIKNAKNGNGQFYLTMNGIKGNLPFIYAIKDGKLTMETTMDVSGWNAQSAIDALNEECKDLHAGADGVTKLWNEVSLVIKTPITKTCAE